MDMKKADIALDKAIESGDPQLGMDYSVIDTKLVILYLVICTLIQCTRFWKK